jgi:Concanavalin A-like lectin/glucanases superfamily
MNKFLSFLFVFASLVISAWKFKSADKTIIWKLNDINRIGGFKPAILGTPAIKVEANDTSIYFNGINDGLVISTVPIKGWSNFTIEVLFKPDGDGPAAPRFIHFEDTASNRGTLELRLTKNGQWYFDGFLKNGKTNKGLALIDSTKLHPVNKWCWAALVYDGKKMYSYINGQKELEGEIDFPPMTEGEISLGVRLNKVNWFKGQIREIRFHSTNLDAKELQHL